MLERLLLLLAFVQLMKPAISQNKISKFHTQNINEGWEFVCDIDTLHAVQILSTKTNNEIVLKAISLPHTPVIEPIESSKNQWQGTSYYRKYFNFKSGDKGKHIALEFEAAMHEADVYLNGKHIYKHIGGYLPFYIDISDLVSFTDQNTLLIKLNNQDNPTIPPGKPIKDLDFNFYGGLYRNASLIIKDKLYISNAVNVDREGGGGVLLHYDGVSPEVAHLQVKTELRNDEDAEAQAQVKLSLADAKGNIIASAISAKLAINGSSFLSVNQQLEIKDPELWSPEKPYLYTLSVQVLTQNKIIDQTQIKTGIKTIRFEAGAFILNGKKVNLRGTNRHQEYPYIGYALPDNAQFRDAWKIKEAGFNFVRSSHYPQSPAFLSACDELGILVMNSIPGWQFFGNEEFQKNSLQDIRDMIHRDRNHPSIILWEASLNETSMSKAYMEKSHSIVHKELPFADTYTCGWLDEVYDVFIPARQHAKAPDYWKKYPKKKPLLIAEYGDWEYYAQNAGFNQKEFKDLKEDERTSRQLRGFGEKRLLQQALNYQEAHNDNLSGPAVGDANWLLFDYKRGYAPDIESSGILDICRLPKFSYYFYKSQQTADSTNQFSKPMVFIANYWNTPATKEVKVYSNCDEVELLVNGKILARQSPDNDVFSKNLKHPPFTFHIPHFEEGILTADGFIKGKRVTQAKQRTPGKAQTIQIEIDNKGRKLECGVNDIVFVYARIVDANGQLVPTESSEVKFSIVGDAELIGANPVKSEAGIATILLKAGKKPGKISISASFNNSIAIVYEADM